MLGIFCFCFLIHSHNSWLLRALSFHVCSKMYLFTNGSKPSGADKALIYTSGQLIFSLPLHMTRHFQHISCLQVNPHLHPFAKGKTAPSTLLHPKTRFLVRQAHAVIHFVVGWQCDSCFSSPTVVVSDQGVREHVWLEKPRGPSTLTVDELCELPEKLSPPSSLSLRGE